LQSIAAAPTTPATPGVTLQTVEQRPDHTVYRVMRERCRPQ
jgi:hypothetical protein